MGRQFLAALLTLVMIMTSGAMTAARGSAQPGTFMVICTGSGLTAVVLDENGEPVETQQVCPDCTLNALAGIPPVPFTLAPERTARQVFLNAEHPALANDFTGPVLPRGPPLA